MKSVASVALVLLVALSCLVCPSQQTLGVDMSSELCAGMSQGDWDCLVNAGYSFAIIQTWQGGYEFDNSIATCVNQAWAAGMAHVDVYAFMCPNCYGNYPASSAVATIIQSLQNAGLSNGGTGQGYYGMLWFDIEQCSGCWNDAGSNADFIADGVNQAVGEGVSVGLYSSEYEWGATMGYSEAFTGYPLWYAHYDDNPSFSDTSYYQFGGWTSPAIKQFWDQGPSSCYVDVDQNWYPDSVEPWWWSNLNKTQSIRSVRKD